MGLCAFAVDLALELLNSWKFTSVKSAIASTNSFWPPYLAFLFFNMGFSFMSGCLVSFAAPLAAGSGIPEVKAYLNGVRIKGTVSAVRPTLLHFFTLCQDMYSFFVVACLEGQRLLVRLTPLSWRGSLFVTKKCL